TPTKPASLSVRFAVIPAKRSASRNPDHPCGQRLSYLKGCLDSRFRGNDGTSRIHLTIASSQPTLQIGDDIRDALMGQGFLQFLRHQRDGRRTDLGNVPAQQRDVAFVRSAAE